MRYDRVWTTVQRRLRYHNINVHNILVRLIVRYTLNAITERFARERDMFLERWGEGAWDIPLEREKRMWAILRRRYDRDWFEHPRTKILFRRDPKPPKQRWDICHVKYLTSEELAALIELRDIESYDEHLVSAIDKAIIYLRPPKKK